MHEFFGGRFEVEVFPAISAFRAHAMFVRDLLSLCLSFANFLFS